MFAEVVNTPLSTNPQGFAESFTKGNFKKKLKFNFLIYYFL